MMVDLLVDGGKGWFLVLLFVIVSVSGVCSRKYLLQG
jgi:hypothetical protein